MFSSPFFVAAVVLASFSCTTVRAQCPCNPFKGNLDDMMCSRTSLNSIPACVRSNVTKLSIYTPSIPLVPDTIRRFTKLQNLYIGIFNAVPQLSKTFLSGQTNISLLSIRQTYLDYVDSDWFQYAPRLKTLHLHNNKIASLASDTFRSLPLLQEVLLANNTLTTLPTTLFQGTTLKYLYLAGNPWNCDCELATFVEWTRDRGISIADQAICRQPTELKGLELRYLTANIACRK